MSGHCSPRSLYQLPGYVISATVGLVLVYINLQPEYEPHNLTRFEQFQMHGKCVGGIVLPNQPQGNNFCTGYEFLFMATCALDFIFLAPLASEI